MTRQRKAEAAYATFHDVLVHLGQVAPDAFPTVQPDPVPISGGFVDVNGCSIERDGAQVSSLQIGEERKVNGSRSNRRRIQLEPSQVRIRFYRG